MSILSVVRERCIPTCINIPPNIAIGKVGKVAKTPLIPMPSSSHGSNIKSIDLHPYLLFNILLSLVVFISRSKEEKHTQNQQQGKRYISGMQDYLVKSAELQHGQ